MAFLGLLVVLVLLLPLVLSLIAMARLGRLASLDHRIRLLESDLADLRRRVTNSQRAGEAAAPSPAPSAPPPRPAPPPPPPPPRPQAAPVPPPRPVEPPPPPKPPIEWERWIGIRGAAVLGGIALALAGLLFFQYSIQHGLISKTMRVILGVLTGLSCLVGSEWIRRRGYKPASEGLAGAGVVVLYAALWAGYSRYQLIPLWLGFVLMLLVTATCGLLAVRRSAPFVAALGLVGGFATPLLLSIQRDRPIGLFGYVLLLDIGLLAVGRKQRWPWIGLLGVAGTVILQVLWLGGRTGPGGLLIALAILAAFAAVFAVAAAAPGADEERRRWAGVQMSGILIPFLFAIYFASRAELGPHLWAIGGFVAILGIGASWAARRAATPALALGAAVGGVATFAVWLLRSQATPGAAWEAVAVCCGLALIYHAFGATPASGSAAAGSMLVLLIASLRSPQVPPWPWLTGWLVLGALLVRQAGITGVALVQLGAMAGVAAALALQPIFHAKSPAFPAASAFLAAAVGVAFLAQIVPFLRKDPELKRGAEQGAALVAAILGLSLLLSPLLAGTSPMLAAVAPLVFGVLILLVGTRLGEGEWALAAVLITALVHSQIVFARPSSAIPPGGAPGVLGILLGSAALFVAWPFVAGARLAGSRWVWWAAAAAGPLWFFPIKRLYTDWRGTSTVGVVPVVLGALALAATFGARRAKGIPEEARRSAVVGLSAVAICLASVAIPLQLDKSWITLGWALEGLGLIVLWRRLDHPGLKWFGLAHLAAAAVRLVPTAMLLDSYPRSGTPIVNWLLYTYLVPAAAMFASAWLLAPSEPGRAREFERGLYAKGHAVGAIAASIGGILTVFVWVNLAIADWFADGPRLTLQFGRAPARDLTVSIAWAVYALVLLGFGMARGRTGLRWLSLGFLLVTIAKVFLYDLGELRELYRVLSLVGLALSLLFVSVLYQRFVFRPRTGGSP